ncbi:MAG TPA: ABC transporter permease, partial [Kiloniellaceae bacterium]|nr:ABC transporter permease [Kiloniellaceae bacterium]
MSALNRKLRRDLWRLRGQMLAIALIVASGVGVLIMSLSSHEALQETAEAYYERYRFAQVFAEVKRAPRSLEAKIANLPGVQAVETRIAEFAVVDVEGFEEPIIGQFVSVPESGQPLLNRLALRSGRWIAPERVDEVIVNEPFAEAH